MPAYTDEEPVAHSIENYSPHASYAVLEGECESWGIQHVKVPYAYEKAVVAATKRNRSEWAHFLATGRGL